MFLWYFWALSCLDQLLISSVLNSSFCSRTPPHSSSFICRIPILWNMEPQRCIPSSFSLLLADFVINYSQFLCSCSLYYFCAHVLYIIHVLVFFTLLLCLCSLHYSYVHVLYIISALMFFALFLCSCSLYQSCTHALYVIHVFMLCHVFMCLCSVRYSRAHVLYVLPVLMLWRSFL